MHESVLSESRNNFDLDDQDENSKEFEDDDPNARIKILKARVEKFKTKNKLKSMRIASQLKTIENNKILIRRLRHEFNQTNQRNRELEDDIVRTREESSIDF